MVERLIRLCLAFAVAFVFAGRMEAAAAHCAQLAQAEIAAPVAEATPCHDMAPAEPMPEHHGKPAHHEKAATHCECDGVLKSCAGVAAATGSAHIEPYEWARPDAAVFASIEPSPALRPPRA